MSRPTKYGEPLTENLKIRLTATERARIDAARDTTTVSEYVRTLIRDHFHLGESQLLQAHEPHRHTPGEWVAERTVKGETTHTYKCAHDGCTVTLERKKK